MIEVLKAYLQVATGVGELTRQRALEAARQALAASPAAPLLPVASAGVDGLTAQASALADELLAAGRQNRELLSTLVRAEVETVVARLGLDGRSELEAALAASRARVRELEQALADEAAAAKSRPAERTAKSSTAKSATAKASTAKRTTAKRTTAKRTTAKRTTAKRTTAKRAATQRTTAKRAAGSADQP